MTVQRSKANPLLTPADVKPTRDDLEILCTLNPAAVKFGDEILLLVRVGEKLRQTPAGKVAYMVFDCDSGQVQPQFLSLDDPGLDTSDPRKYRYHGRTLLTSISHLRIARSRDGENFSFDPTPAIFPSSPYETYGCEDARITFIDGRYYIAYTAVSPHGVAVALASTTDFVSYEKHGVILPPYNKDVCIFPEKIGGKYVCRHRPYKSEFNPAAIWTAYSPDFVSWGNHTVTLSPSPGTWEAERVGCGAPPIKTDDGWLEIYHAADDEHVYHLGAMLSDLERPEKLISRAKQPVISPETNYELDGVYGEVVFSNGLILDDDGTMTIYYGAADTICGAAVTTLDEMIAAAKNL